MCTVHDPCTICARREQGLTGHSTVGTNNTVRITSTDQIAGLPALELRDALRYCRGDEGFYLERLADRLRLPQQETQRVLDQLVQEGYVEPWNDWWRTTISGNALCNAKASKPVSRAKAQAELDGFMERVAEVETSDRFLCRVERVILFGSFLDPWVDPVGDVDLAIEVSWKPIEGSRPQLALAHAKTSGRRMASFVDKLTWPEREVRLFVKGKSRVLSIASTADAILETSPHRTIYAI